MDIYNVKLNLALNNMIVITLNGFHVSNKHIILPDLVTYYNGYRLLNGYQMITFHNSRLIAGYHMLPG